MIQDTSSQDRVLPRKKGLGRGAWVGIATAVIVLAGGISLWPSLRRLSSAERSFERERLRFATVARGNLSREVGVEGRIVASSYPTIYSPASGRIDLLVKAGDRVELGQAVADLDSPELRNLLQQEQSQALALESELSRQKIAAKTSRLVNRQDIDLKDLQHEAAKRAFERAKLTYAQGLINATEYEEAEDLVKITELELRNARSKAELDEETMAFEVQNKDLQLQRQRLVLEDVKRRVAELSIKSPADGVVGTVNVDPRDFVNLNQPLLTVIDLSAFEIEISIPESYADEIVYGTGVEITYENRQYPGMVSAVAPEVNNSLVTGTVVFTGELPRGLKQNQRVSSRLILATVENALKVRRGPFLETGGGRVAYVVENDMALRRPIETGVASLSEVEILDGLSEGETIVISDMSPFGDARTVFLRK